MNDAIGKLLSFTQRVSPHTSSVHSPRITHIHSLHFSVRRSIQHSAVCAAASGTVGGHKWTRKQIKLNEIICYMYIKMAAPRMGKCRREILGKKRFSIRFSNGSPYTCIYRLFLPCVCSTDPQMSFELFRSEFFISSYTLDPIPCHWNT